MRRRHGHLAFGVVALAVAAVTLEQAWRLREADRVNTAISAATASRQDLRAPEAQFARAVAFARGGEYDEALAAYKAILQVGRKDLREAALYDLGNLNLRQALKNGVEDASESLPLIELAKQNYRDALREQPEDWDARYNLERALRLAPEAADAAAEEPEPPVPQEHERSTAANARMDLP